jgi:SAM-dependent methyltransferase
VARTHLARARKLLPRHLAGGWARAVFAAPGPGDPARERVLEGPGLGDPADPAFAARRESAFARAMEAAAAAADDGLFRHTFVLDPRRSVRLDARDGRPRRRERSEESLRKTMGGKARSLRPDRSEALLRAIGIMNADGSISARHAKKYKQVCHLVEVCRPLWADAGVRRVDRPWRVLDLACGNSYAAFVLGAELASAGIPPSVLGVDVRSEVVTRSRARAEELGFADRIEFEVGSIRDRGASACARLGGSPDLLIALHACDTASDEAIALGIRAGAGAMLVSPCCHGDLARALAREPAVGLPSCPTLYSHGLLRSAFAEVLTDALRVEVLEASGYVVSLLELVEAHHAPKNLLIRARRRGRTRPSSLEAVASRWAALGVHAPLFELLGIPARSR